MLAFACAFTMFAGAAFTDQADIAVDSDVVDTLVALGVIDGYEDGTFRPDDTVTRAEMAKMIYTVRTGRSDASAYNDDTTSFTDITSHWARGYIKYCQSMGIIAGKSVTSFDPDGTVTTQEAAKMLLVTLGYNAERAGLEGASWGQKTTALADENGLLEDVNCGTTQGMPRQYAAQLIFNAINASTVVWRDDAYTNTNYQDKPNQTIGEKYMGLENPEGILKSVKYDDNDDVYITKVVSADEDVKIPTLEADTDYSALMGQEVQALYKENRSGDIEVYGLFATSNNDTVTALYDDAKFSTDKKTVTIDGEDYNITGAKAYALNGEQITTGYTWQPYYEATLIDNNKDDVYDYVVGNPFSVEKVTSVTTNYIYFAGADSIDRDECNAYDGIAKDDYVLLTDKAYTVSGKYEVVEAETISGEVEATKKEDSKVSIRVDGTWYKQAGTETAKAGNELQSAVVVNGFYFTADTSSNGSIENSALVLAAGDKQFDSDYYEVKLLLSNGDVETTLAYVEDENGDPINSTPA